MTLPHLKALQDSVGQASGMQARFAWDRKAAAHAQVFNVLADVITDRPVPPVVLNQAVGAVYDLMITVGPAADRLIASSRRRLLERIRAGDADGAAAVVEHHLRVLRFMGRLSQTPASDDIAV